jgi:hypothetical protein
MAEHQPSAFGLGDVDVVEHFGVLVAGRDGTDLGIGLQWVTHARGASEFDHPVDDLVVHRALD